VTDAQPLGSFTFVLHSHIPYARMAGRWPHGEEWVYEAAADTYLPLLAALHDLAAEGVNYRLTISLTPVLAEQLADRYILNEFGHYLRDLRDRAAADVDRFQRSGETHAESVARFYAQHFEALLDCFDNRFGGDLIGAFRWLQDEGYVELATSAATHGYLPLFERDSSIYAQVRQGVRTYRKHFGRAPESFWLPECAYRPAKEGRIGLEAFLAAQGLRVFFVESHTILGGQPTGKAAGDALGPYGKGAAQADPAEAFEGLPGRTTFQPYFVHEPRVAAIGRNVATGLQVWSAEHGYPGDFAYREFHSKDSQTGMRYWRVTGADVELGEKKRYDPWTAFDRAAEHARHFAMLVEEQARGYRAASGRHGIVSAAYDTELFGHWWFEGVAWLKDALRLLAHSETVALTSAGEYVREHRPEEIVELPESSWGEHGTHHVWLNDETAWMWPLINERQRRIEEIVAAAAAQPEEGPARRALEQLARELFLLESSDWPFLVTTGQARAYAEQRFHEHRARFDALAEQLERGAVNFRYVDDVALIDQVFDNVDPADFAERQGWAETAIRVPRARR